MIDLNELAWTLIAPKLPDQRIAMADAISLSTSGVPESALAGSPATLTTLNRRKEPLQ